LKLTKVAVFAYGYFIGARAGRERYAQIVNVANRRPSDSRSSARVILRSAGATIPVVLTAVPDRRGRPSDGVLVEGSILTRLFGIRLLTLDATVVVVPADVSAPRQS